MFVTRTTLRGLTQLCGAFGIHLVLLVTIILYYPKADFNEGESDSLSQHMMSDRALRDLMIVTHCLLAVSTLCTNLNFLEGISQQILSYTAVLLYFVMIASIVKELYV